MKVCNMFALDDSVRWQILRLSGPTWLWDCLCNDAIIALGGMQKNNALDSPKTSVMVIMVNMEPNILQSQYHECWWPKRGKVSGH